MNMMVGSYAPKATAHSYITPLDEAPSGLMGRGTYSVSSLFTDDDKKEHLKVKRQPDALTGILIPSLIYFSFSSGNGLLK